MIDQLNLNRKLRLIELAKAEEKVEGPAEA
jgi:hypothetical protein